MTRYAPEDYRGQHEEETMSEKAAELKSCPFCGSTNVFAWDDGTEHPNHSVICPFCCAQGPEVHCRDAAVLTWNTRAEDIAALRAQLSQLEAAHKAVHDDLVQANALVNRLRAPVSDVEKRSHEHRDDWGVTCWYANEVDALIAARAKEPLSEIHQRKLKEITEAVPEIVSQYKSGCFWCDHGYVPIPSSVSDAMVHPDATVGRVVCTRIKQKGGKDAE